MKKNKTSVGQIALEIAIVIVGISIAFWVNSWGEEYKERALEVEFLKTMHADLKADSSAFEYQIENNIKNQKVLKDFMNLCREKRFEKDSVQWYVGRFLNRNNWILNSNTFEILKNGGKLDIIEDFDLRNEVSFFYKIREFQTDGMLEFTQQFLETQMYVYLTQNSDYFINDVPNTDFVQELEFQNLLGRWYELSREKLDVYRGTLRDINNLLPKLRAYIE